MKYLKKFNEVNEDHINEGLKNMFLVPLLVTMGYINSQNVTPFNRNLGVKINF
jgi:hypothetical protein